MMDERIIGLIAKKLSGEASSAELNDLSNYVVGNPESVFYIELISRLWQEEKTAFNGDAEADYIKHIAKYQPDFEDHSYKEPDTPDKEVSEILSSLSSFSGFRFAFIVLFFAVIGCIFYFIPFRSIRQIVSKKSRNIEWIAAKGTKKIITLPDGTKVWLNAGSRLSYDSGTYNKDKRSVSLSGEAFFDVTKNKERPFIIRTNRICIKVLGTAFNVKAYPEDKITETTLLRGSIELTVNNKPCRKIMLRPNEKFLLIDDLPGDAERKKVALTRQQPSGSAGKTRLVIQDIQPVLVANKEYVEEISWMNNDLVFENESLEELAPRMERWFNVTIEINDASLKSLHFTGVFHKETIGEALSAMQLIKPFTYQINQNHVHIN